MKKNPLLLICIAMFLLSCNAYKEKENIIGLTRTKGEVWKLFDSIKVVPLQSDTDFLFGEFYKIEKTDSAYYIMDNHKKKLFKYSKNGNPMARFDKFGNAGHEYLEILDISVNDELGEIYLVCEPCKLFILDTDFNIKEVLILDMHCDRIAHNLNCIYTYSNINRTLYKIENEKMVEIKNYGRIPNKISSTTNVFHKIDNKLLFVPECESQVYELQGEQLIEYLDFTYPDENRRIKRIKKGKRLGIDEVVAFSPLSIKLICETETDIVLFYVHELITRCCKIYKDTKEIKSDEIVTGANVFPLPLINKNGIWIGGNYIMGDVNYTENVNVNVKFMNIIKNEDGVPTIYEYFPK